MTEIEKANIEILTDFVTDLDDYDGEFIQIEVSKAKVVRAALLDYMTGGEE